MTAKTDAFEAAAKDLEAAMRTAPSPVQAKDTLTESDPVGWYLCDDQDGSPHVRYWDGSRLWFSPGGAWVSWIYTNFRGPLVVAGSQPQPGTNEEQDCTECGAVWPEPHSDECGTAEGAARNSETSVTVEASSERPDAPGGQYPNIEAMLQDGDYDAWPLLRPEVESLRAELAASKARIAELESNTYPRLITGDTPLPKDHVFVCFPPWTDRPVLVLTITEFVTAKNIKVWDYGPWPTVPACRPLAMNPLATGGVG